MRLTAYKKTILSWKALKKLVSSFLQILGAIGLILGIINIFLPKSFNFGTLGLVGISCASLFLALLASWPRREISRQFFAPDFKITIKVGDLFLQDAHLVVGMNDVFDTEKGDIISPHSIQGQFLTRVYNDDRTQLDRDIENALQGVHWKPETKKSQGKNKRYPVGTVATLARGTKKYFCVAYSVMGNNLKAKSDRNKLAASLETLWEEIRLKGQREKVAMAVLGSDLARIGIASHATYIKLITSSFIFASREETITQELVIIIHPSNLELVNMIELDDFLQDF